MQDRKACRSNLMVRLKDIGSTRRAIIRAGDVIAAIASVEPKRDATTRASIALETGAARIRTGRAVDAVSR